MSGRKYIEPGKREEFLSGLHIFYVKTHSCYLEEKIYFKEYHPQQLDEPWRAGSFPEHCLTLDAAVGG